MAAANKIPDNLNYLSNISFRLTMQDAPNLTWFCQAINVPGVSIEGIDVFTSGKDGILLPGIPVGKTEMDELDVKVRLFSDPNQLSFVTVQLIEINKDNF